MYRWDFRLSVAICIAYVLVAAAAPWLALEDYSEIHLERRFRPPDLQHWFGCDELGRDIWSRWVYGARISLMVSISVTFVAGLSGGVLGILGGYIGGWLDVIIMRLVDVVLALPGLLLALAFLAFMGAGLGNLILALILTGWAPYARLMRGATLRIREEDFVMAARAAGASTVWIVRMHIIPHLRPLWLVQASLGMAGLVLAESGLSFLGLGVQPPVPSWGQMLTMGIHHLVDAPHLAVFPGVGLSLLVLFLTLIAENLEGYAKHKVRVGSIG